MADEKSRPGTGGRATIRHSLYGEWSQDQFGDAIDVPTLSVIGELDPTGAQGVVREVLVMFQTSLEPELARLEECLRASDSARRILFEAHRLKGAAAQLGALRVAATCDEIEKHLAAHAAPGNDGVNDELRALVERLVAEIIRVQRRLRALLGTTG